MLPLLEGPSPPRLSWGPAVESTVHWDTLRLLRLGNPQGHLSGLALLVILHGHDYRLITKLEDNNAQQNY